MQKHTSRNNIIMINILSNSLVRLNSGLFRGKKEKKAEV